MNLRHVALVPCELLAAHGAMCVELVLGGQLAVSLLDVVKLIDQTVAEHRIKTPIVVVDGRVPDERDPDDVLELVQVLRRKQYNVFGRCGGSRYPRWLTECTRTEVMVTNEGWLEFQCDELQYIPPLEGPLLEPSVGAAAAAIKTIYVGNRIAPATLFEFLALAQFPWQLALPPKLQYAVVLLKEL